MIQKQEQRKHFVPVLGWLCLKCKSVYRQKIDSCPLCSQALTAGNERYMKHPLDKNTTQPSSRPPATPGATSPKIDNRWLGPASLLSDGSRFKMTLEGNHV